jgi:hypothetical protein
MSMQICRKARAIGFLAKLRADEIVGYSVNGKDGVKNEAHS